MGGMELTNAKAGARRAAGILAGIACALSAMTGMANPPGVVFDTDMVTDYDDVGALACLHALADEGKCEILATASCTRDNQSVAAVEILNAFYGRPEIPVGCAKGIGVVGVPESHDTERRGHEKYARLAKDYATWVKRPNSNAAPDANAVYRKALAAAPDGSVVFCSVGFMTNLRRLLETGPDAISPLGGRDLVAKKVKSLYAMGGSYPKGREYNVRNDAESAKIVFARWPTAIYVVDFNLGRDVYSGRGVAERAYPFRNPVHDIFARCLPARETTHGHCDHGSEDGGRSSWDELTVLAAVTGAEAFFKVVRGGLVVADDGSNTWSDAANAGGALQLDEARGFTRRRLGEILDELIARPPARPWGR